MISWSYPVNIVSFSFETLSVSVTERPHSSRRGWFWAFIQRLCVTILVSREVVSVWQPSVFHKHSLWFPAFMLVYSFKVSIFSPSAQIFWCRLRLCDLPTPWSSRGRRAAYNSRIMACISRGMILVVGQTFRCLRMQKMLRNSHQQQPQFKILIS